MKQHQKLNRKVIIIILTMILILTIAVGCSRNAEDDIVGPMLWRVTSPGGQTIYLFGSIHVADENIYPLPDAILEAFASSEYLTVEYDVIALEQNTDAMIALSMAMMYMDGRTIADDIGQELHGRATALMADLRPDIRQYLGPDFPLEMLDGFKPQFWIQLLTAVSFDRSGLSTVHGIDRHFTEKAKERGMEILEIENAHDQINMLVNLSTPLQKALLESAMKVDEVAEGMQELYDLWLNGDKEEIENYFISDMGNLPSEVVDEYISALLTQRDIQMTAAAERYLAEGKKVFFVVGIAHMLTETGIVEQLKQNGHTVERVPVLF